MSADSCDLLCLDLEKAESIRASRRANPEGLDAAAARLKALSDPTRLGVATALLEGEELCVCDLAWICERAENLISHHLKVLRREGLVSNRRDGKMVLYALTPRGEGMLSTLAATEFAT